MSKTVIACGKLTRVRLKKLAAGGSSANADANRNI